MLSPQLSEEEAESEPTKDNATARGIVEQLEQSSLINWMRKEDTLLFAKDPENVSTFQRSTNDPTFDQ